MIYYYYISNIDTTVALPLYRLARVNHVGLRWSRSALQAGLKTQTGG